MRNQLIFLFLLGIVFIPQILFAQANSSTDKSNDSSWGLKLGVSNHWQNEGDFNFDADIGFLGGMYFKKPFGKFIATSYEWQVMQMGYRINETNTPDLEKIIINRNYIQAIVNLHVTPVQLIDISIGVYGGIAIGSNEKWHYVSEVEEREKEDNLRQLDIGAKLNLSLWLNKLGLGLEYYHGVVNTNTVTGSDFIFTNRAISISAKYIME